MWLDVGRLRAGRGLQMYGPLCSLTPPPVFNALELGQWCYKPRTS